MSRTAEVAEAQDATSASVIDEVEQSLLEENNAYFEDIIEEREAREELEAEWYRQRRTAPQPS